MASATLNEAMETPARATSASLLDNPAVAWPTVVLWAVATAAWFGAGAAAMVEALPWWAAAAVQSVAAYLLFTPMHDSAHRSVSRYGWINAVVGRLCALVLMAPFIAFRFAHLRHHRRTNEHHEDPDMWSGTGPWWQLPLRWVTQDLHYYAHYLRHWSQRPAGERVEVVGSLVVLLAVIGGLVQAGFGLEVLLLWALPARLAIGALAFFFDYLPHHPHEITGQEDRYRATTNLRGAWLTPVMVYQNYHLLHHLYPSVPFYRYGVAWRARQRVLEARGGRTRGIFERGPGKRELEQEPPR